MNFLSRRNIPSDLVLVFANQRPFTQHSAAYNVQMETNSFVDIKKVRRAKL